MIMRKQLWAVAALALLALQPAHPQAKSPEKTTVTFNILQAQPLVAQPPKGQPGNVPLPADVTDTAFCIVGGGAAGGLGAGTTPACRFVGSVLCLDAGADGKFTSFTGGCPADTDPVVQGIKLIKTVPKIAKCPDLWPGQTFVQTQNTGIRTFFPLKFTPCDTTFSLQIEIGCVTRVAPRHVQQVRVNEFVFKVSVRPETLAWVVEALHCEPLGVCEVPCITDEALFQTLLTQAGTIASNAGDATKIRALNTALDTFEATVVKNCMFANAVFTFDRTGVLSACSIFNGQLPSNDTIGTFNFGIVDTIENPCCCKLISDIICLKNSLIGIK
jgi:hypothetical protein